MSSSCLHETATIDPGSLAAALRSMPRDKRAIAFFINRPYHNQHRYMDALAARCRAKGYLTIALLTRNSVASCAFSSVHYVTEIDEEQLLHLGRIDLFFISDMDAGINFPQSSKVLGCFHALYCDQTDASMAPYVRYLPMLDGWLIPGQLDARFRSVIPKVWNGFLDRRFSFRKADTFHIIPAPYPRLALMQPELAAVNKKRDAIVYAPILADHGAECGGARIKKYGMDIVTSLLAEFPQCNVIFRPSYQDLRHPDVLNIVDFFKNEPRFVLDDDIEQVNTFAQGIVLITDKSNVSNSFSFATLQPSIQFQPWLKDVEGVSCNSGSYLVTSFPSLLGLVGDIIAHQDIYREKVRGMRDALIVPLENGLDRLADIVDDFLEDSPPPQWLGVRRFFVQPPSDLDIVLRLERHAKFYEAHAAAVASIFTIQSSALLVAYALHKGLQRFPDANRIYGVGNGWECATQGPLPRKYREVNPAIIIGLYDIALEDARRNRNERGMAIISNLRRSFRNHVRY